ncbi:hypothetical protein C8Q77DRAFT_461980 [Trametes polyzona]|nr:hypothetical protein C8Q77DRAFT_461980 [Trametes polyzona]
MQNLQNRAFYASLFLAFALGDVVAAQRHPVVDPSLAVPPTHTGPPVPPETGPLSLCLSQCFTQAGRTTGCTDVSDLLCVCTNLVFWSQAEECARGACPAADQASIVTLFEQTCSPAGTLLPLSSLLGTRTLTNIGQKSVTQAGTPTVIRSGTTTAPLPASDSTSTTQAGASGSDTVPVPSPTVSPNASASDATAGESDTATASGTGGVSGGTAPLNPPANGAAVKHGVYGALWVTALAVVGSFCLCVM